MRDACEDMLRFSGEPARPINAEYLFTVAVAKQISKLNCYHGDPYKIYLEKSVKDFARDCLPPIKFGHPTKKGSSILRRKSPKIAGGRIDVAVYEEASNSNFLGYKPVCAVELKGFNPPRSLVIKDLKRNLRYFGLSGDTGGSSIKNTIFAALHFWSKSGSEEKETERLKFLKTRYTSWLSELGSSPEVEMEVNAYTVRKDFIGEVVDEGEYQTLDTDTIHHFAGITVEFRAKELSQKDQFKSL